MDGTLADFCEAAPSMTPGSKENPAEMYEKGFFKKLKPMPGAKEAIARLEKIKRLDLYIATKPTTKNLNCATEKYEWIEEHFPSLLGKMFLTCDKALLRGDYLIDDYLRWKTFQGTFVHFDETNPGYSWGRITEYFVNRYDDMK